MNKFLTNKDDITNWLDKNKITDYKLVPHEKYGYVVNVKGNINLISKKLTRFPIKFNKVIGNFHCYSNKLVSLEGCPQIVKGSFYCSDNELTSLEFSPQMVNGNFDCSNNQLTSLDFCPKEVRGYFSCSNNQLSSLEFCPQEVEGRFFCNNNLGLGELQRINDFSIIYQEHLKYKEKKDLAYKLEKELNISVKSTRIKI